MYRVERESSHDVSRGSSGRELCQSMWEYLTFHYLNRSCFRPPQSFSRSTQICKKTLQRRSELSLLPAPDLWTSEL